MIEVKPWMEQAVSLLKDRFGSRLLFVGLQGSHRRGEAREDSDIDILVVLDTVNIHDLTSYREALLRLPEGEKACGFTCGKAELLAWPPFEIFQFTQDIDAYYGELAPLLPAVSREDIETGVRAGLAAIYHAAAYLYITGDAAARAAALKELLKSFYFSMQLVHYLRHGVYARSKRELLPLLSGDEAALLRLGLDAAYYEERRAKNPDELFQLLFGWAGQALREFSVGR